MKSRRFRSSLPMLVLAWLAASAANATDGVTEHDITFGQSCALTGPARELGHGMKVGLEVCFADVNAHGGVNGRHIHLITKDDGCEPNRAIRNTRELLERDKVFLLIGEVGIPTSNAILPIAQSERVPFFAPLTGAESLRNPTRKYVINVRASYTQEITKIVDYLVNVKKLRRIACLYQNDDYGLTGLQCIRHVLSERSLSLIAADSYESNTVAVRSALLQIRDGQPQVVVLVGAYKPCAEFIRLARQTDMSHVLFCNLSFVGTEAMIKELGPYGQDVLISQALPLPGNRTSALVANYRKLLKAYASAEASSCNSLEGFIAAKLLCLVLQKIPGEPTREAIIETIETKRMFDLDGEIFQYGPDDHQGFDNVFLTVIRDGKAIPF